MSTNGEAGFDTEAQYRAPTDPSFGTWAESRRYRHTSQRRIRQYLPSTMREAVTQACWPSRPVDLRDAFLGGQRRGVAQHRPGRTPLPPAPPAVREVTGWITRRPGSLTGDEPPRLKAILERRPELRTASEQVRAFAVMITQLTGQDLPQWIAGARTAGLRRSHRSRPERHLGGSPARRVRRRVIA